MILSDALKELWEFVQDYCSREKIDVPDKAVEARKLLENLIAEKEKPVTYEDSVHAREVWFKELLVIFLPDILNEMIQNGKILIPSSSIE